ncbi:MAG: FAD-dependent oxidoreductase [Ignavibacteriales bacterium]|nr:FAD-dependent oxidoreductase [Ignavibacteriales bacterium]MCF8438518.1 FAD-dependent oxidoreductase [Ignavibacteriales bacterium]
MSNITSNAPVVIIGAGIAGLTAAYCLKQKGISAIIIEAADRVGGRMTSDTIGGHVVDRGAQFLSTEYRIIIDMLRDLGLSQQLCETSQCSAIVRVGQPRRLRASRPLDALNLFGFYPMLKLAWNTLLLSRKQKDLSLSDYSQWMEFDTESTSTWSNREIDPPITEYLFEPMLQGFYFQTPEETSKAMAVALSAFGIRRAKTLSLRYGLGNLPETLAQGMNLKLDTPVHAIECLDGKVLVHTASETLTAHHVIVAVPAPVAKNLIVQRLEKRMDEEMQALLATPYSASINIACVTDKDFALPSNLKNIYGLLIPRKDRTAVSAVGIENNKNRGDDAAGHLFNIMLSHRAALEQMQAADNAIVAFAAQSVSDYFPTLPTRIKQSRVYRWPAAEPLSPVGRAATLRSYRQRSTQQVPSVLLAGDYMSMPFTEGAAESGYWAASLVAKTTNQRLQGMPASGHP